ncbi:serine hydrolase domain-containing protein [Catenulispora yoronensis]|uniref:Serine hydrolase domain-containing protein n=1 Tax=Catenulispora yoronensis TaxID=450799 RepID=A0ABN2U2U8_9ACTN
MATELASALRSFVSEAAKAYEVPGISVGILHQGSETYAPHGVTNVDHPVPVDEGTLFHIASATKSFTATAVLNLVAAGRVDLDAPVRRYVPELVLADDEHADRITVRNLLNHTAGLDWNLIDTDEGDGSLAGFVAKLGTLSLVAEPGARASYSQAGYNILGRVIENVTGRPYEKAVADLVLAPLALDDTVFDLDEVVRRKFAIGHKRTDDGALQTATPWKAYPAGARGNNPGGGAVSTARDLLRWGRFHLEAEGSVSADEAVLSLADRRLMREPSAELRGSSLGDALGFGWFLKTIAGVPTFGHGGSGNGQFAEVLVVPDREFAVVALSNSPEGYQLNQAVVKWALEHCLGVVEADPEPVAYDPARNGDVVGRYEIDAMNLDIADDGKRLTLAVEIKPEIRSAAEADMPPDIPASAMGFLAEEGDDYIVTEGEMKGQRGFFSRDESGAVVGIDLAGRIFGRSA